MAPPSTTLVTDSILYNKKVTYNVCRDCNHIHFLDNNFCSGIYINGDILYSDAGLICSCQEYVPIDNLKYLEWLYNKKVNANV